MSGYSHMGARQDATKKRREYLRKKVGTGIGGTATAGMAIGLGCVALLLLFAAVQNIGFSRDNVAFFAFLALAPLAVAVYLGHVSASSFKEVRALSYVPPVAEQLADLPAEEILLRGSDQPMATPGELLRAASGSETGADELLRPTKRTT